MSNSFQTCRTRRAGIIILAWLMIAGAPPPRICAADGRFEISDVQIGFDGRFKVGTWTRVSFDVSGPAGVRCTPRIRAADPDGRATLQPLREITLTESPARVQGLFQSGRQQALLQLQILTGDGLQVAQTIPVDGSTGVQALPRNCQVWLTVGKQPLIRRGISIWKRSDPDAVHLIELEDLAFPIESAAALDGVDVIVVNAATPVVAESSSAIREWVLNGGRLVMAVGDGTQQFADSVWTKWMPLTPGSSIDIAKLDGLNGLVPRSDTLRTLRTLPGARLDSTQGVVLASSLTEPLLIRAGYGAGEVTMLAVTMDQEPLSDWSPLSQAEFASVLADLPPPGEIGQTRDSAGAELNPSAVTDLQMQLNNSLDSFPEISRPSHWIVMGWIALFAVLIGPVDYFLLHYVIKRPEWTWVTLLLWVGLASWFATVQAHHINSKAPGSRQIDLTTLDGETGAMHVDSWYGYYSDHNQRGQVTSQPHALIGNSRADVETLRTCWVNRPGDAFRSMGRGGGINEALPGYEFLADMSGIKDFPTPVWGTGLVTTEWDAATPNELVVASLSEQGINRLSGTIRHKLPGELTDWFLAYESFLYFPSTQHSDDEVALRPGEEWNLETARSYLMRDQLIAMVESLGRDGARSNRGGYQPLSSSPLLIALTATFYETLGGEAYTGLKNDSLRDLDLSNQLSLNRAVLFGRLKHASTEFQIDGKTLPEQSHESFLRVLLPVQRRQRAGDAPPPPDLLRERK